MGQRAPELFEGDVFTGDGLHDVGTGDEHVTGVLHHEDEVRQRRGVDATSGARTEDHRDLRHDAGRAGVADEDPAVGVEGGDALLNSRAGAVVQSDDRQTHRRRHVHDLVNLLAVGLADRAAEDREVLGEDADLSTVDLAVPGDHPVGVGTRLLEPHARGHVTVQHVQFLERVLVEQVLDALARGHLALGLVSLDGLLATGDAGLGLASVELGQAFSH